MKNISDNLPNFYLSLLEFLMNTKHLMISVGNEYDLTSMQTMTLLLTKADEPQPMNNFCKLYNCDASNVTGIIDGLEQKGLVSRREDPHDRRIKIIQLEQAGRILQTKIIERFSETSEYLFESLDESEAKEFRKSITKIASQPQKKYSVSVNQLG